MLGWSFQSEEGFEAMEASSKAFLDLLESPLHDQKLKDGSLEDWLAECEQTLQQAGELLDPSASASGPVSDQLICDLQKLFDDVSLKLATSKGSDS